MSYYNSLRNFYASLSSQEHYEFRLMLQDRLKGVKNEYTKRQIIRETAKEYDYSRRY